MTGYARPRTLDEALGLLGQPGARAMGGGTDLMGQVDRDLADPELVVDLRAAGLGVIEPRGDGLALGAAATLADLTESDLVQRYPVLAAAAASAASPLLRNVGTVGGNLCQGTRCWYFRGVEWTCWLAGGDTCYAQIGEHGKHNLQPGDCISAHPSDLAPALAVCGASVSISSAAGTREVELLDLYRRPSEENRSLVVLEPGEIVVSVQLPAPPSSSVYLRLGERQAFSFPLVSVAAARRDEVVHLAAAGVANVPVGVDPDDPLRDLPGNPQSGWKRTALQTLVDRALRACG